MATIGEYYEKYQSEELCKDRFYRLYPTATPEVKQLIDRVGEHEQLFSDMIFEPDSLTGKFIAVSVKRFDDDEWEDTFMDRPDQLEYFMYSWFVFGVEDLNGSLGSYSPLEYKLTIAPEYINRDDVILHEMIHLHESVLDGLPTYFRDAALYCLYRDLRNKIPDIDDRIEAHGHILNESNLSAAGGRHDILFLLKSFDLDLRMDYPLGTVFGYGMAEEVKEGAGGQENN